jgi:hypothetical protein
LALAIFEPNLFLYKYPNILNRNHSPYLPTYEDGTDSVLKHWHIKFRCQGITQKKAYNINILVLEANVTGRGALGHGFEFRTMGCIHSVL